MPLSRIPAEKSSTAVIGHGYASGKENNPIPTSSDSAVLTSRIAANPLSRPEVRWSLAFVGVLLYVFVEYTRLPEMYPALAVLQLAKIAIAAAAVGYLFSPHAHEGEPNLIRGIDLAIFLFIIGNLLAVCFAPQTDFLWDGFSNMLVWGVVYFLTSRIVVSSWRVRVFVFLLLLLNFKLAQFGVRQYFVYRGMGFSDMEIIRGGGSGGGNTGFFGDSADYGVAMAVIWGIVYALLFGRTEKNKLSRIFLMLCFVVVLMAILLCGSRGAVVGAAAIVVAALAKTPRRIGAFALAVLFLLGVWFVLPGASKERFRSAWDWQNDQNAASRVNFWRIGLQMFSEHPVFGIGADNFGPTYALEYGSRGPSAAHSIYIQTLAETGSVGAASILVLIILFFRLNARTRKAARESSPDGKRSFEYSLALGLDLALVGYLTSGAFVSVLYYPHLWILLGLSVGLNTAAQRQPEQKAIKDQRREGSLALAAS